MIAAARTAGVREDQNLLRAVHERLCLGDIATGATGLKLFAPIASDDQPTGSPGDLCYLVGPDPLAARIESGGDRRQSAELLDQSVARVQPRAATPEGTRISHHTFGARSFDFFDAV